MRNKFKLKQFRPGQLEIMNSILLNKDCFILMPTGGGKSLFYQLPAIISNGITIVISPLISLIKDQIEKLNYLNIPSENARIRDESEIYADLNGQNPTIKLLYVTPEKLSVNRNLHQLLKDLNNRKLLDRFVID